MPGEPTTPQVKFKKIRREMKTGHYLVTNNLQARDAHGRMSHVWLTDFVQKSGDPGRDGEFICFDTADRQIFNLTHYAELELPI